MNHGKMAVQKTRGPVAKDFMSKNVLTVYQHENVSHAVETMARNNIGSVVVLDNIGPCGVFTERDLLAKVIAVNKEPQSTIVMEVLSPAFPAIEADTTAEEAAAIMIKKKNRLMVLEGANLMGIITPTDIVRVISNLDTTFDISTVISKRIVSIRPETPIDAAVKGMAEKRVGSVMVWIGGRPIGIFTERDLLKKVLMPGISLKKPVEDVMSSPLITTQYGTQAREVAKIMVANNIKRLPLYKDDKMVGMVTARDLVEAFATYA
jgi:CBS domain-containing protein